MLVLGIESSCDETAAAVVTDSGTVLSNVVSSQIPIHARFGGVIPEIASRNHLMAIVPTVDEALERSGSSLGDIGRVAVTQGPGLLGSLLVGVQFAKTLALSRNIELTPVHHVEGHITAVLLEDGGEHPSGPLAFPYVALAVSGGHTSLYLVRSPGDYALLAVTLDDAAGEAFDKVARLMGLPYPGGVEIDRLSTRGRPDAIPFPRPLTGKPAPGAAPRRRLHKSPDFSFSGLKTAVRVYMENRTAADRLVSSAKHPRDDQSPPPFASLRASWGRPGAEQGEASGWGHTLGKAEALPPTLADVAASFQEAVVDVLVHKTLAAATAAGATHVVISGGVASNRRLREKFVEVASASGFVPHVTARAYCTDNAAMIAGAGRFATPLDRQAIFSLEPFASGQLCNRPGPT